MSTDNWWWSKMVLVHRWDFLWDAYNTVTNISNLWTENTYWYKFSVFSTDANWEDLEYMIKVDWVQKWHIYTALNKNAWNSIASWVYDTSFKLKLPWSTYSICNDSLEHENVMWNWSIANNNLPEWCWYYFPNWFLIHWGTTTVNPENALQLYWLAWSYNNNQSWTKIEIFVRK
jgi:hypothetical protein